MGRHMSRNVGIPYPDTFRGIKVTTKVTRRQITELAQQAAKKPTPSEVRGISVTGGRIVVDNHGHVHIIPDQLTEPLARGNFTSVSCAASTRGGSSDERGYRIPDNVATRGAAPRPLHQRLWRWLTVTVRPWLWIPFATFTSDPVYWSLAIEFYIDWAPGYHFDGFGVWLKFGPWIANLGVKDNN